MHQKQSENFKGSQREKKIIIKGVTIKLTANFLTKTLEAERYWNFVKILKENIQMF